MVPSTPVRGHKRGESSVSVATTTPPGGYVSAQEETPTRLGHHEPESAQPPKFSSRQQSQRPLQSPSTAPGRQGISRSGTQSTSYYSLNSSLSGETDRQDVEEEAEAEAEAEANQPEGTGEANGSGYHAPTPQIHVKTAMVSSAAQVDTDDDQTPIPRRIDIINRALDRGGKSRASEDESFDDDELELDEDDEDDGLSEQTPVASGRRGTQTRNQRNKDRRMYNQFDTPRVGKYNHRSYESGSGQGSQGSSSGSGSGSINSDSVLEVLDNDDVLDDELGLDIDEEEGGDEGLGADVDDPLVSRGRRRRRKRWNEAEEKGEKSLFEVSPQPPLHVLSFFSHP